MQLLQIVLVNGCELLSSIESNSSAKTLIMNHFIEGVMEHFFSEFLKQYNEEDVQWFFDFLSRQDDHSEDMLCIKPCVAKFYLNRILQKKSYKSTQNILNLFNDEVSAYTYRRAERFKMVVLQLLGSQIYCYIYTAEYNCALIPVRACMHACSH